MAARSGGAESNIRGGAMSRKSRTGDSMETLYKWLNKDRSPCNGGRGVWPEPGEWLTVEGELIPCSHGIHLCRERDIIGWIGPQLWIAQHKL